MGFRVTWIIQQEQPEVSAACDLRATVASPFATVCSRAIQHGSAVQPWTIKEACGSTQMACAGMQMDTELLVGWSYASLAVQNVVSKPSSGHRQGWPGYRFRTKKRNDKPVPPSASSPFVGSTAA